MTKRIQKLFRWLIFIRNSNIVNKTFIDCFCVEALSPRHAFRLFVFIAVFRILFSFFLLFFAFDFYWELCNLYSGERDSVLRPVGQIVQESFLVIAWHEVKPWTENKIVQGRDIKNNCSRMSLMNLRLRLSRVRVNNFYFSLKIKRITADTVKQ